MKNLWLVCFVETHCNASLRQRQRDEYQNFFGPQSQNLSAIIRGFKGAVTKRIHMSGFDDFAWQERFYDHVIRNDKELGRIREYISNNPYNWNEDKLFVQKTL